MSNVRGQQRMPFHHVLVSVEAKTDKLRCIFSDLSEGELQAKFVSPYRKGQALVCPNEVIPISQVRKVHVVRTSRESSIELSDLQTSSYAEIQRMNRESTGLVFISAGRGYDAEDILETGEDVTSEYLLGPPGIGIEPTVASRVVNHPWAVAIGTGVLVAAITWWLGWS
jgi:hypothetical protein